MKHINLICLGFAKPQFLIYKHFSQNKFIVLKIILNVIFNFYMTGLFYVEMMHFCLDNYEFCKPSMQKNELY